MARHLAPRPPTLSRRSFLALASAAVWLGVRPARAGPGGGGAPPSALAPEHALRIGVPGRTANGAKVPIVVEVDGPMTAGHHVETVRVTNDGDPIASKGTFHFTPANGRVYIAFQARMHEGSSRVTATAECNLHGAFAASSPIEIPPGAGGCVGGGAALGRTAGEDIRPPVIRIPELVERGAIRRGEIVHVQVKMRHPNRTGLSFRDGRFVAEGDPIHIEAIEVSLDAEPVSRFEMTAALSDDPLVTFGLLARRDGTLRVVVTNNRRQRLEATHELRVT